MKNLILLIAMVLTNISMAQNCPITIPEWDVNGDGVNERDVEALLIPGSNGLHNADLEISYWLGTADQNVLTLNRTTDSYRILNIFHALDLQGLSDCVDWGSRAEFYELGGRLLHFPNPNEHRINLAVQAHYLPEGYTAYVESRETHQGGQLEWFRNTPHGINSYNGNRQGQAFQLTPGSASLVSVEYRLLFVHTDGREYVHPNIIEITF